MRSRNQSRHGKEDSITYSEGVSVALVIQHFANASKNVSDVKHVFHSTMLRETCISFYYAMSVPSNIRPNKYLASQVKKDEMVELM